MKEYRLKITGMEEFIIISPKVLALLLKKINGMENHTIEIPVESIMPPGYTQYLLNVINSNRDHKLFNFFSTTEEPLQKEHIYKIIEHQMRNLKIESEECFKKIVFHMLPYCLNPVINMHLKSHLKFDHILYQDDQQ